MRILLISSSYAPVLGGLQTIVHALAAGLVRRGHEVKVVTNRYPVKLAASETIEGVPVSRWFFFRPRWREIKRGRLDLFLASVFFYPCTLFSLILLVIKFRPEVINLHFPDSQIHFVRILRRLFRFKLVVTFHGHDIQRHFDDTPMENPRALQALLAEADAVTACSKNLINLVLKIAPVLNSKAILIGNGIDPSRFESKEGYRHPKPYLFASGRLTFVKGFDLLIEAFSRSGAGMQNLDLIIAGDGEERAKLELVIARFGLKDRVHLIGRVLPAGIVKLLNGCEFAVVSSRSEQFGVVALEAMAAGRAVLATRVGGLPEFIDAKINQLVEPTAEGLAEGLKNWMTQLSEIRERGESNRKEALKHTLDKVVEKYLEVYLMEKGKFRHEH